MIQELGIAYTFDHKEGIKKNCFSFVYKRYNIPSQMKISETIYILADNCQRAENKLYRLINHWNTLSWEWKFTV